MFFINKYRGKCRKTIIKGTVGTGGNGTRILFIIYFYFAFTFRNPFFIFKLIVTSDIQIRNYFNDSHPYSLRCKFILGGTYLNKRVYHSYRLHFNKMRKKLMMVLVFFLHNN